MPMRINGLSTGFDTDTAVQEMMKANRIPYNRLLQKKQTFEWQREQYRDMNLKLTDYRNNKLFDYRLSTTFSSKKTTVTGNTSALSATSSASATAGTYNISVTSLATSASKNSTSDIRDAGGFNPNAKLSTMGAQLGGFSASTFAVQINGTTVNVNINNDSLNDVLNRVTSQTNVSAFYDSSTGKVSFSAKESGLVNGPGGNSANISFVDDGDFLADNLNIDVAGAGGGTAATDAVLTINGMATTRTSNTFDLNGTTISLLQASGGSPTTVKVGPDVTGQVNTIKSFIADYNEMLTTIQGKISEPKYRSFQPLTAEEKEAMKEGDIEKYEEKAKSGMLRNDSVLSMIESKMRSLVTTPVETGSTKYKTLSSIGISTGAYQDKGKLVLKSEAKLREALEEEPESVMKLFNQVGNGDSNNADVGIANRLYDSMNAGIVLIKKKAGTFGDLEAGSFIGNQLFKLNKEISKKQDYLTDIENKLYKQFAAMERAMSNFNAQSTYLGNNIAAMNNSK